MTLSGLKERRSSAGRRLLLQSIVADIDELCTLLKNEVHERVSREIWLEADEGIDYASLADQLQRLQPVELVKAVADEEEALGGLNRAVEALSDLLFSIADALDRHHSNEDYLKLFDDQMKLFVKLRYKNAAKQSYTRWCGEGLSGLANDRGSGRIPFCETDEAVQDGHIQRACIDDGSRQALR